LFELRSKGSLKPKNKFQAALFAFNHPAKYLANGAARFE